MDAIDYEGLVERLRTQSSVASGSDTERVWIRTLDDVTVEQLRELPEALDTDVDIGACSYYLSPSNANAATEDRAALEDRLGHPVTVEDEMVDDAVLFMDPDAVGDDGEITDPSRITLGTLE
ncbi:hypothetical protein [Natronorarus salvus]|uniref:hypothetical protein n=1 Tax=Natronorarus salvus TaxID=3117733 RepID=UPI002F266234